MKETNEVPSANGKGKQIELITQEPYNRADLKRQLESIYGKPFPDRDPLWINLTAINLLIKSTWEANRKETVVYVNQQLAELTHKAEEHITLRRLHAEGEMLRMAAGSRKQISEDLTAAVKQLDAGRKQLNKDIERIESAAEKMRNADRGNVWWSRMLVMACATVILVVGGAAGFWYAQPTSVPDQQQVLPAAIQPPPAPRAMHRR